MKSFCRAGRWRFASAAVLLSVAVALTSCSRKESGGASAARPAVPVLVAQAATRDVPVEIRAIGSVQAYSVVSVRPQITGPIMQVHFQEGQEVRAGDLLFTIDPRPWQAAVNQAQANLRRDQAQLLNARLQFERTSNLFVSKIASQSDYDTADANYQAAQSTVGADDAAIVTAQVSLGYTEIRSPVDGRTGSLAFKAGNVVKAPDDALVTLMQIHPIYVSFAVPEQNLPDIRRRSSEEALRVAAVAPGDPHRIAWGQLTFIDNTVDTNTGTILLRGTFANTNNALWPGQFVQTTLSLSNLLNAIVVPAQAVQPGQNGEYVFVTTTNETVEARAVTTGLTFEGLTVIHSGLSPGETVVTDGQLRLVPGAKISVKPPDPGRTNTSATNATSATGESRRS